MWGPRKQAHSSGDGMCLVDSTHSWKVAAKVERIVGCNKQNGGDSLNVKTSDRWHTRVVLINWLKSRIKVNKIQSKAIEPSYFEEWSLPVLKEHNVSLTIKKISGSLWIVM